MIGSRDFAAEGVKGIQDRLETLDAVATRERDAVAQLNEEKDETVAQVEEIEADIVILKETLAELEAVLAERSTELEATRKSGSKSGKILDKAVKEIAGCVSLSCKLEWALLTREIFNYRRMMR